MKTETKMFFFFKKIMIFLNFRLSVWLNYRYAVGVSADV